MLTLEFIEYKAPMAGDKHFGIVTVMRGDVTYRFKITQRTDGTSLFPSTASFKAWDKEKGKEGYDHAFELDSKSESERLNKFVMAKYMENKDIKGGIQMQGSIHSPPNAFTSTPMSYPDPVQQQQFQEKLPF